MDWSSLATTAVTALEFSTREYCDAPNQQGALLTRDDSVWGNSLSYINSKATGGSPTPQVLEKVLIPSNKEFAIYSDKPCTDGSCGYVRPGSVAYRTSLIVSCADSSPNCCQMVSEASPRSS